jgi:hydrogenase assembly chaperone HypC/HupF
MCIGFPGIVISVDEVGATVDQEGRLRRASTLLIPDIAPGDHVFVAAGTIVERLDPGEADLIRATLLEAAALVQAQVEAETEAVVRNGGPA